MNFHWPFTRREQPQPLRAIVATKAESLAARRRAADRLLELAVYVATTSPQQRRAETEAYFAVARTLSRSKQIAMGVKR